MLSVSSGQGSECFVCKWQIVDYHSHYLLLSRGKGCSEADKQKKALHFMAARNT